MNLAISHNILLQENKKSQALNQSVLNLGQKT